MPRPSNEQPWWLEGGWEICPSCLQRYAHQMEHRCAGCDVAMCWFCAYAGDGDEISCIECRHVAANG